MTYIVGDTKIDNEHREILHLFDLFDNIPEDQYQEFANRVKKHVVIHFIDEEFIFTKQYNTPQEYQERHIAEHEEIRNLIIEKLDDLENLGDSLEFIEETLTNHIVGIDLEMSQYIINKD